MRVVEEAGEEPAALAVELLLVPAAMVEPTAAVLAAVDRLPERLAPQERPVLD